VVGFTGDGGSMYTPQALWTAARYDIAAKFVICNNGRYKLLDNNIAEYWRTVGVEQHEFPDLFDLSRPAIDFSALSAALGVPAVRVEKYDQVAPAITEALAHPGPFLIDLVIGRDS
jgi:benzoylformate decarboxylase